VAQVKARFLLPVRDNDGRVLRQEIEAVEDALFAAFGGWTSEGYVQGAYRMADQSKSLDTCAAYMVIVEDAELGILEGILREFRAKTTQECIYLEILRDVDVRLVR